MKNQPVEKITRLRKKSAKKITAVPIKNNLAKEREFSVNTGKKSNVVAKNTCNACGTRVSKHKLISCTSCGSYLCSDCYNKVTTK